MNTPAHDKIFELIPLAVGGDLEPAELAEVDAHRRECPACAAEWEAYARSLSPLRRLREQPAAGMPLALYERMRAEVLARVPLMVTRETPVLRALPAPTPPLVVSALPGKMADGARAVSARRGWRRWALHPAMAATLLIGGLLGALHLPSAAPVNPPAAVPAHAAVPPSFGTPAGEPMPMTGAPTRVADRNAVQPARSADIHNMGSPFPLRTIEASQRSGGIRIATPADPSGAAAPRDSDFKLPRSNVVPDETDVVGSF